MVQVKIPAVSREMEFIATHADEADDIWEGNVSSIQRSVKELSDAVYVRADNDVVKLLGQLKNAVEEGANGLLRLNSWHWPRWQWEAYSDIHLGMRGRKKVVGWVGLHVGHGKEGFRLIGFMTPRRGGLDGRKKLALRCKKKITAVHLTRDDQKRYPRWNDNLIWFEKKLSLQTSLDELRDELRQRAKTFFAIVKPLLKTT